MVLQILEAALFEPSISQMLNEAGDGVMGEMLHE